MNKLSTWEETERMWHELDKSSELVLDPNTYLWRPFEDAEDEARKARIASRKLAHQPNRKRNRNS